MGKICKLSKTSVKNFIASIDKKTDGIFNQALHELNGCKLSVSNAGHQLTSWAYSYVSENLQLIADALELCNRKIDKVNTSKASTPDTIKKEEVHTEKVKNEDGTESEKKVSTFKEEPNPLCDVYENQLKSLREYQQRLNNLASECRRYRSEIDLVSERTDMFLSQVSDVERTINDCKEISDKHIKQLKSQAQSAYNLLCDAMKETSVFPAMKENDGYIDISGVCAYCSQLQMKIDDLSEKLKKLQQSSSELCYNWNDKVYEHFNNIVQNELPERLQQSLAKLYDVKNDLEEMCNKLNLYYESDASIELETVEFSYCKIDLEKGNYGYTSLTCKV